MLVERVANISDISFINSCALYGARKGHYAINTENPEMVAVMKKEVKSIITEGLLFDQRRAVASVFTIGNIRAGMLIMCEVEPNAMGYEIYAMSVAKKHQCKGYGGQILDHVIKHFLYYDVVARCMPVSEVMKKLLINRGFVFHGQDGEYEIYIKGSFDCSDMAEPLSLSNVYGYGCNY